MENSTKITIEDLAVKLNGNMWTKGDLKRIYLDRGYNTKKMSTKTYVEETSEGNFNVKCFVECPSQDYNWCTSQAEIVIESVDQEIAEALVTEYFYVVNQDNQVVDDCQTVKPLTDLYVGGGLYLREGFAKNFIKREDLEGFTVKSISRVDYQALEVEPVVVVAVVKEKVISKILNNPTIQNIDNPTFGAGTKIKHERFGVGVVLAEDGDHIEIQFDGDVKKLLKRFAKLSKVD